MNASEDRDDGRGRPKAESSPRAASGGDAPSGSEVASLADSLEEFIELVKAGKQPARDEFLARHGPKAGALGECLEGLEWLMKAAPQFGLESGGGSGSDGDDAPLAPAARLGDYRVVREVGRGGMGVVYEAEQVSL